MRGSVKYLYITLLTLLVSMSAWADGPQAPEPELSKAHINECSDGITQTWTYESAGSIFHGKNLDKECAKNLRGVPTYNDSEKNFIFKGNKFWFFTDTGSNGSEVIKEKHGIVVTHIYSTFRRSIVLKGVLTAQTQEDITSTALAGGDYELFEDYYISTYTKGYISKQGGAFWYNAKRNYDGEILELIDLKKKTKSGFYCVTPEEAFKTHGATSEEIKEAINPKTGLSGYWLAALTYHKRPTWCYSQ